MTRKFTFTTQVYDKKTDFPETGDVDVIYVDSSTNTSYRYDESYYRISSTDVNVWGALGSVSKGGGGGGASWGDITGTLSSQTDLQSALNAKQNSLGFTAVPTTRTITINGTAQDLSSDRSFTVTAGITIGTTAITSGTIGRILYQGTGNVAQQSASLTFDGTKLIVGISGNAIPNATQIMRIVNNTGGADTEINGNGYARLFFNDYSQGANLKYYEMLNYLGDFKISRLNDANSTRTERLTIFASTGNVNIGTTNPSDAGYKLDVNGTARIQGKLSVNTPTATSAVMEITSTTQGFMPPRMTTTQKNAISSPAAGLIVYDTTLNKLCVRTASAWETITSA